MYEVEFLDGEIKPYAANMIAENIWSQVNPEGQHHVIFESIIDHHVNSSISVTQENIYCYVNVRSTMCRSTAGVKL